MIKLSALVGIALLLWAASAVAGSFPVIMDVAAYVDAASANESFSESDLLWAAAAGGTPAKEVYLSFLNNFVEASASNPDMTIKSATLKMSAKKVEAPGVVKAYFVHNATLATTTWNDKQKYEGNVSASLTIEKPGDYSMDVTPIIKRAVDACPGECGYSIVLIAEDNASIGFASGKDGEGPALEYET